MGYSDGAEEVDGNSRIRDRRGIANNCVDVNAKDMNGRTPPSWAAGEGHHERAKLLLGKNGIDPDSKDDLGQTPLWWQQRTAAKT